MAADPLDVLTIDEGKDALQHDVGDSVDNEILEPYITAVSRMLDREAGAVVQRDVELERHDGGGHRIHLRVRPVAEITTLVEYQGTSPITLTAEAAGTTSANAYLAEPYLPQPGLMSGTVRRRSGGYNRGFWCGGQNVVVTYVAGRYEDTAGVDARFKRAASLVLLNLWRDQGPSVNNDGEVVIPFQSFPGFAFPNAARELLAEEVGLRAPWGYR